MAEIIPGDWPVTNAVYHADRGCVSHSALEVFRASRPLYHAQYVTGTIDRDEPTAAMILGQLVDCLLLEPARFELDFAITPACDGRTKAGKEIKRAFAAKLNGRQPIDIEDETKARLMVASIRANPQARQLLEQPGKAQRSVRWLDTDSNVWLKARFDYLCDDGMAIDLKTAADPSPDAWARQAHRLGYHRQCALYLDGRREAIGAQGISDGTFLHIVVGSSEPYECFVFELETAAIQLGRRENAQDLDALAVCRDTGCWDSPYHGVINTLSFPRWAYAQEQREWQVQ